MELCDLHTHSAYSDGTYTPTQIIEEAERAGLFAVALTDHNTVAGLDEFLNAAKGKNVRAIAGIEISTAYESTELHIVGLGVKAQYYGAVTEKLKQIKINKERSNIQLAKALSAAGYFIDYEALKASAGGQINRAHFAGALVEKGYVGSIKEAFDTLLAKDSGFYKEPERLDVFDVISFLKSIGATVVLAHPFLNLDEARLRVFLTAAIPYGLDAMETLYSTYDNETTDLSARIAKEFKLKQSGGSDFHGARKPVIALGRGRGNLFVPSAFLEALL